MANPGCQPGVFDIDIDGPEFVQGIGGPSSQNGGPGNGSGGSGGSGDAQDGEHAINLDIEIQV